MKFYLLAGAAVLVAAVIWWAVLEGGPSDDSDNPAPAGQTP